MNEYSDEDSLREKRENMVRHQLASRDISDPRVLDAFRTVPREAFVREKDRARAYDDRALPTRCGQTISQPYMVASMTQALKLEPGNKVLEIGTGSGYQTAILAEMGGRVYTVERHRELTDRARETLEKLGYRDRVWFRVGDGTLGWPEKAPFDRILVTAGAPEVPSALREQTAVGGRIVIPVGSRTGQRLQVLQRDETGWSREESIPCVFVPLVGDEGWDSGRETS